MKKIHKISIAAALGIALVVTMFFFLILDHNGPSVTRAATTPSLGTAATYGVLASTYTNTTVTTVNGDVGFTTGPAIAPAGTHTNYGSGAPYSQAGTDEGAALSSLASQPCTFTFASGAIDLSIDTTHGTEGVYNPGVYCSTGAMTVVGTLTFSGTGTYIFRAVGALNSAVSATVSLTNGASACDIFWTATQATTLGANTIFAGTVIDDAGITVGANSTWTGRALTFGGTATTDTDTITVPTCAVAATLHVIKLVVNANGGTAVASNFTVHVENAGVDVLGSPQPGTGAPGTSYSLSAGTYTVSENSNSSYTQSFSGTCSASGSVTLGAGQSATCTIINSDIPKAALVPTAAPAGVSGSGSNGHARIVPLIGVIKVPTPLALASGPGSVTYNYTVWNVGGAQALDDITLTDDKCPSIVFLSGDLNGNGKLDPHEDWRYSCTTTLSTTTTNTAIATGYSDDPYHQATIATAIATVVVGSPTPAPLINIVKVPSCLTPLPFGGGSVTYAYAVTNPGVVAMSNVSVTDNKCSPVSFVSGDTNGNGLLDSGETWIYTCTADVTVSTMNTATAEGSADGFTAINYAFATVLVSAPGLPDTGFPPESDTTQ